MQNVHTTVRMLLFEAHADAVLLLRRLSLSYQQGAVRWPCSSELEVIPILEIAQETLLSSGTFLSSSASLSAFALQSSSKRLKTKMHMAFSSKVQLTEWIQ